MRHVAQVLRMLEKDLKLFLRDYRTLLLIILTPLLIMLVLGSIFSGKSTAESITGVSLGVCDEDGQGFAIDSPIFSIADLRDKYGLPCSSIAKRKVERGELRGAVIIPEGFSRNIRQGYGSTLELYYDKSKSQTAVVTLDAMKAIVQDINEKVGVAFIKEAWDNLNRLNAELKLALERLVVAKDMAMRLQRQAGGFRSALDETDMGAIRGHSRDIAGHLADAETLLEEAEDALAIAGNQTQLAAALHADLNASIIALDALRPDLSSQLAALKGAYATLCAPDPSADPCPSFLDAIGKLGMALADLDVRHAALVASLGGLQDNLDSLIASIGAYEEARRGALERMTAIRAELAAVSDENALVAQQLARLDGARTDLLGGIERMQETLLDTTSEIILLVDQLNQTTMLLDAYTSRDPIHVVRAVSLDEHPVYGEKSYFGFLAPGLMALVLLFITLFISSAAVVTERLSGTMARTFLTPMPPALFLLGKALYLLILCGVQLLLMSGIMALLGVSLGLSLPLVAVMVSMSLSFIGLGLLIGSVSKTENTALLTCLVLGIPMLFLSGLFFPFEIMPRVMKAVGSQLPLTLSIMNLERLAIYRTGADAFLLGKLAAVSAVLFLLAYIFIKRRPTPD